MRQNPDPYRLSFLMPADAPGAPAPGLHEPSADGCALDIHRGGLVVIIGPSREAVFEHAARFLRIACAGAGPFSIAAVLLTPARILPRMPSGRDSWLIIVGAEVAFAPTSLPPHITGQDARAPPHLVLVRAR